MQHDMNPPINGEEMSIWTLILRFWDFSEPTLLFFRESRDRKSQNLKISKNQCSNWPLFTVMRWIRIVLHLDLTTATISNRCAQLRCATRNLRWFWNFDFWDFSIFRIQLYDIFFFIARVGTDSTILFYFFVRVGTDSTKKKYVFVRVGTDSTKKTIRESRFHEKKISVGTDFKSGVGSTWLIKLIGSTLR